VAVAGAEVIEFSHVRDETGLPLAHTGVERRLLEVRGTSTPTRATSRSRTQDTGRMSGHWGSHRAFADAVAARSSTGLG
jgi:hypothetical protein